VPRQVAFELDAVGVELVRHRRQKNADRHAPTLFERRRPVTRRSSPSDLAIFRLSKGADKFLRKSESRAINILRGRPAARRRKRREF
jgi:hypothetical protein